MLDLTIDQESFEALDPAIQAEYKKSGDDYHLEVPSGLVPKIKVDEFRKTNVKLKKDLAKFEGLDPEEAREALERKEEFEAGDGADSAEKIRVKAEELANKRIEKINSTHAAQLKVKEDALARVNGSLQDRVIGDSLRKAGAAQGLRPEAVDDLISRGRGTFRVGEDGSLIALDSDGETPRLNDRGDAYSPTDFVGGLSKTAPHLFGETTGSGSAGSGSSGSPSGTTGGANPWAKSTFNLTRQGEILKSDPKRAQALAAKEGKVIRVG